MRGKKLWQALWVCLALLTLLGITSCGGGGGGGSTQPPGNITVSIDPPTPTVAIGSTIKFTATVDGSSNQKVTWSASAGSITSAGVFTPPTTAGSVTVTATADASSSAKASVLVTVSSSAAIQISISPPSATVGLGSTTQFSATVTGSSDTGVTWSTNGGSISSSGLFTAPSTVSTVTVLARSKADLSVTATAQVSVTDSGPLVSITPAGATLAIGAQQQFHATVTNSSNTAVTWSATGGSISSSGLYTAGSTSGTFQVTATSVADNTRKATVLVTIQAVTVTVSPGAITLVEGTSANFTAKVTGTSNSGVTWTATDGTIDSSGHFTAPNKVETVTVTATSKADNKTKGTATVTVEAQTDVVYDFESGVPTAWSPQTGTTAPSGQKFLGQLGTNQSATLTLTGITPHTSLRITFDLYLIGGWDANKPFTMTVDGTNELSRTFSNISGTSQSYPDGGTNDPGTGSVSHDSLGYTFTPTILFNDTIYHITVTVPHTDSSTSIVFQGDLDGALSSMGWGLDNVQVNAIP